MSHLIRSGAIRAKEPYTHTVPFSHRSGQRIEPLISLQWFMKMDELAAPAIQVVKDGRVRIHPESQSRRYIDWLENIRPWCISRQLWWGHQIPVWYRGEEVFVGTEAPEGEGWERDPDVLDTWFSSALWPFATLGWPEETPELRAFYPTDVLSTARDILFLWVARMVMMGLEFTGDVPFRDVYVHSVIQAPDGRRMSKSLGTGIDPLDLIEGGPRRRSSPRAAPSPATVPTACALACWRCLHPGRALQRGEGCPGPGAGQQALQRDALRRHQRRRGDRAGGLAADGGRPLDPEPPRRGTRRLRRARAGLRLLQGRARVV